MDIMKQEKGITFAMLGTVAIVLISGLVLMLSGAKTGQIVTYKNTYPGGCYESMEDACERNMRCETWHKGEPVRPQPSFTPVGYIACRCPNQLNNPTAYRYILRCA